MSDRDTFRAEQQERRDHGLKARHEKRLENATYTAAEVKVLTEAALRLGRKEAAEELAETFGRRIRFADRIPEGERSGVREGMYITWIAAQRLAQDMASLGLTAASDATSRVPRHPEVSEAPKAPQEPCGHPTCPCASQEAK